MAKRVQEAGPSVGPPPPATDDAYALLDQIGEGTFSVVYKARRRGDNALVAVKRLKAHHMQSVRVRDEAGCLLALARQPNPHIVGICDAVLAADGRVDLVLP